MEKSLKTILIIAIVLFITLLPTTVLADNPQGTANQGLQKLDQQSGQSGGNNGGASTGSTKPTESSTDNSESGADNKEEAPDSESSGSDYHYQTMKDVEEAGTDYKGIIDTGKLNVGGKEKEITETSGFLEPIIKAIIRGIADIIQSVQIIISVFTNDYLEDASEGYNLFTIQDTVFGKISLFDIDFFDTKSGKADDPNVVIREQVKNWYFVLRNVALIASLLVLIYIGIRMAVSTIAQDQAKYKQMIVSWLKSIVILFILPYILMATMWIAQSFLEIIPNKDKTESFEARVTDTVNNRIQHESILVGFGALITLGMLTYYQVKFFIKYLFRFFKAAFLVMISPLITITYALDKGSAHDRWLQEYISVVFMQVIHAFIYSIFMFSAGEIAARAPIIAVAFFMALSRGEKIITYLMNIKSQD